MIKRFLTSMKKKKKTTTTTTTKTCLRTTHANKKLIRNKFKFNLYVQVRFELNYMSEISYLTVHIYEKTRKDASFDMTLK